MINVAALKRALQHDIKLGTTVYWKETGEYAFIGSNRFAVKLEPQQLTPQIRGMLMTLNLDPNMTHLRQAAPDVTEVVKNMEKDLNSVPYLVENTGLTYKDGAINMSVLVVKDVGYKFINCIYLDVFESTSYYTKSVGTDALLVENYGIIAPFNVEPYHPVRQFLANQKK